MRFIKKLLLATILGCATCAAWAQVLSDFAGFSDPGHAYFAGDWAVAGAPRSSFVQGAGHYEIKGGTNSAVAEVMRYPGAGGNHTLIDASDGRYVAVSARILTGNQAGSFSVVLYDSADRQAYAIFNAADFGGGDFRKVYGAITAPSGSFDFSQISAFRLSGDTVGGAAIFNIAFDHLEITPSAGTEPAIFSHWWELDEAFGTTAVDSVTGTNGTLTGGTWYPSGGRFGGCLYIGSSLWHRVNAGVVDLTATYTVAAWIKVSGTATTNQVIFSNRNHGLANNSGCSLLVNKSDHLLRFYTANGSANSTVVASEALTPDVWQHVAVTVNNTTGACRLYLNGVDVTGGGSIRTNAKTSGSVSLGNYTDGGWGQLHGYLDDVVISNAVLSPAELAVLMGSPSPTHRWALDESSGTTVVDAVAGTNGTLIGGAWYPSDGRYGGCLYIGSSLWHRVNGGVVDLTATYTVAAWIKVSGTATTNQVIFSNRNHGLANNSGCSFLVNKSDHLLRFYTANGSANSTVVASEALTPDVWQHVAVAVNNTTGVCRLYLNGVDVTGGGSIRTNAKTSGSVSLGNYTDGGWGQLHGYLDDVAVYDAVLSPDDISLIHLND